ncbi:sensor histidine kinase [Nonomuraea dietziae]|uniref:sensor histidine kinase n=1 Tax=Nonomuraea dietziae TaxID=65515 RepID=UPI003413C63B
MRLFTNAATGVAALVLLLALPFARRRVLAAARRLAGSDPGDLRLVAWLFVHGVTGPAALLGVVVMLSALGVIWTLRTAEASMAVTLTLSLSMLAIVSLAAGFGHLATRAQARLADLLLHPDTRVRELADAQAAELRRIERDLHDGAQARLISIRMTLGLARSAPDPRGLIEEAWESAGQALTDLRDLVRNIHPPVLADRGLVGALQAAALLCPVPVRLDLDLEGRPEAPVESALYFAATEALSNIAKHSGASSAWVRLTYADGVLRLTVGDDGRGGADPAAGTGLRGIARRLSAFEGTLTVHSPPGGPSELIMELPCALSSPKISLSSGTG